MLRKPITSLFLFSLFVFLFVSGCAAPQRRGGKLSDAADQAAKEPKEQEPIHQTTFIEAEEDAEDTSVVIYDPEAAPGSMCVETSVFTGDSTAASAEGFEAVGDEEGITQGVPKKPSQDREGINLGLFYTNPAGNQIDEFKGLHLRWSARSHSQTRWGAGLYGGTHTKGSMSGHAAGINSPFEVGLDIFGRFYLTEDHTFMGMYGLAGARWGFLAFSFTNPITVAEGSDSRKIKNDEIQIYTIYAGTGLTLMQARHLHIGAAMTGGVRIGNGVTQEGFDNDLFPPVGYMQFTLETTFILL